MKLSNHQSILPKLHEKVAEKRGYECQDGDSDRRHSRKCRSLKVAKPTASVFFGGGVQVIDNLTAKATNDPYYQPWEMTSTERTNAKKGRST